MAHHLYGEDGNDTIIVGSNTGKNDDTWQYLYGGSGNDSIDAKGGN